MTSLTYSPEISDAQATRDLIHRDTILDEKLNQLAIKFRNIAIAIILFSCSIGFTVGCLTGANMNSFVSAFAATGLFLACCIYLVKRDIREQEKKIIKDCEEKRFNSIISHLVDAINLHNLIPCENLGKKGESLGEMFELAKELETFCNASQEFKKKLYNSSKIDKDIKDFINKFMPAKFFMGLE